MQINKNKIHLVKKLKTSVWELKCLSKYFTIQMYFSNKNTFFNNLRRIIFIQKPVTLIFQKQYGFAEIVSIFVEACFLVMFS